MSFSNGWIGSIDEDSFLSINHSINATIDDYSRTEPIEEKSELDWVSLTAAFIIGPIANIYRVALVLGCHEFEAYVRGCAGVLANIFNAFYIPMTNFYAFIFFGEVLRPIGFLGGALVVIAIFVVTGARMMRRNCENVKDSEKPFIHSESSQTELEISGAKVSSSKQDGEYAPLLPNN